MKKNYFIYAAVITSLAFLALSFNTDKRFGAGDGIVLDTFIESISSQQDLYKTTHPKYQQVLWASSSVSGTDYRVDEYVSPLGSGYEVVMYRKVKNCPSYKSIAFGPEALIRSYDWTTCPTFVSSTSSDSVN